jgi:hypothetical protein
MAIAKGPFLARAFARWHPVGRGQLGVIVAPEESQKLALQLPVQALPLPDETKLWLAQLGLLHLEDLAKLPSQQLLSRLGYGKTNTREGPANLSRVLAMLEGEDDTPLEAHAPTAAPSESSDWEQPVTGSQPLRFAAKGLLSKIGARLEGRGLAAQSLRITIQHDPSIARFRNLEARMVLDCPLSLPLFRAEDLWRVVTSKLEQTQLSAPCVGLRIEVTSLTNATHRQLDLMSSATKLEHTNPERLQVLFSELAAEIGHRAFGTLRLCNSHRPEKLSLLQPVSTAFQAPNRPGTRSRKKQRTGPSHIGLSHTGPSHTGPSHTGPSHTGPSYTPGEQITLDAGLISVPHDAERAPWQSVSPAGHAPRVPNRLLAKPIMLSDPIEKGALVAFGGLLYAIRDVSFEYRLDCVEWWSGENISRDYLRVSLAADSGHLEALIYKNRVTGRPFLQAIYD